jgi:hypothetical protein
VAQILILNYPHGKISRKLKSGKYNGHETGDSHPRAIHSPR